MNHVVHKLSRVPLRDQVAEAICNAILSGRIAPGDKIPEQMLAEQLGTSRVPVREAIRILESQGLVVARPKAGTFVARLSPAELDDSMRVRAALEELAVTQALARLSEPQWDRLCDSLEALIAGMRDALATEDAPQVVDLDYRWHSIVIEASSNRTLIRFWQSLGLRIRLVLFRRAADQFDAAGWEATIGHHCELLAAFRRRDPGECRAAVQYHVLRRLLTTGAFPAEGMSA